MDEDVKKFFKSIINFIYDRNAIHDFDSESIWWEYKQDPANIEYSQIYNCLKLIVLFNDNMLKPCHNNQLDRSVFDGNEAKLFYFTGRWSKQQTDQINYYFSKNSHLLGTSLENSDCNEIHEAMLHYTYEQDGMTETKNIKYWQKFREDPRYAHLCADIDATALTIEYNLVILNHLQDFAFKSAEEKHYFVGQYLDEADILIELQDPTYIQWKQVIKIQLN